ncbi:MAG: hypothetical protein LBQ47_06160 [Endomicrobium sp.]|jgi:ADP-heptose:LPS heptosyltransferase|nr:hypothetical protein [Endomicrobium sp.]
MKRKLISFAGTDKGLYIVILERYKTKIFPSPLPKPIPSLIKRLFGSKTALKDFDFSKVSSVLLRPGGGVGDAVIFTASLRSLKQAYKNIKIGVIADARDGAVFNANPDIDVKIKHSFWSYLKNRKKWDVFIDALPFFNEQNIFYDALLSPKYKIAFQKKGDDYYFKKNFRDYDYYVSFDSKVHYNKILTLTPFKPFVENAEPKYFLQADKKLASYFDAKWEKNKIRILFNSSGTTRTVNEKEFKFLIGEIGSRFSGKVDLLMLNNRRNRKYFNLDGIKVSQPLSLEGFIALTSTADIIITADTSLVHMACAFNKRLISFFANSPETAVWSALNDAKYKVMTPQSKSETFDDIKDLKGFDMDAVLRYVKEFIGELENLRAEKHL